MKMCENCILSDPIQTLANVCELQWKLNTTLLNTQTQSYCTYLLALIMVNTCPDLSTRARQYQVWGDRFMGRNIEAVMG
jgi:hypothetical protein